MVSDDQAATTIEERIRQIKTVLLMAKEDLHFHERYYSSAKYLRDQAQLLVDVLQKDLELLQQGQLPMEGLDEGKEG